MDPRDYRTVNEVAEELDVHPETIRTAIKRGNMEGVRAFEKLLVHKDEVEAYRTRTRGATGEKPTGRPAKTPPVDRFQTPRAVGRPRKGG